MRITENGRTVPRRSISVAPEDHRRRDKTPDPTYRESSSSSVEDSEEDGEDEDAQTQGPTLSQEVRELRYGKDSARAHELRTNFARAHEVRAKFTRAA